MPVARAARADAPSISASLPVVSLPAAVVALEPVAGAVLLLLSASVSVGDVTAAKASARASFLESEKTITFFKV